MTCPYSQSSSVELLLRTCPTPSHRRDHVAQELKRARPSLEVEQLVPERGLLLSFDQVAHVSFDQVAHVSVSVFPGLPY